MGLNRLSTIMLVKSIYSKHASLSQVKLHEDDLYAYNITTNYTPHPPTFNICWSKLKVVEPDSSCCLL